MKSTLRTYPEGVPVRDAGQLASGPPSARSSANASDGAPKVPLAVRGPASLGRRARRAGADRHRRRDASQGHPGLAASARTEAARQRHSPPGARGRRHASQPCVEEHRAALASTLPLDSRRTLGSTASGGSATGERDRCCCGFARLLGETVSIPECPARHPERPARHPECPARHSQPSQVVGPDPRRPALHPRRSGPSTPGRLDGRPAAPRAGARCQTGRQKHRFPTLPRRTTATGRPVRVPPTRNSRLLRSDSSNLVWTG